MVKASASALGHPMDAIFQNQDKKDLTHIDMMNHLIPNTSQFYIPKLHQSVVLQVRA